MLSVICHQDNLNSYGTTYNYISSFKNETKITKTTYNTLCWHGCGAKKNLLSLNKIWFSGIWGEGKLNKSYS